MIKTLIYSSIYILGVLISAFAQILLKNSANIKKDNKIREYLNFKTILAYLIFFGATLCTVFAYKYVPLSMGPILGTTEYLFVAILSYWLLKEKISKKKLIGLFTIMLGILIFSI
ncbi:MAG: EamA family transporter [Clostridia bacterium]